MTSLHQMRDVTLHNKRRRHGWDMAFTAKALRAYDSRVIKYTNKLLEQLRKTEGKPTNMTDWCMWFGFDVMGKRPTRNISEGLGLKKTGDLAFGRKLRKCWEEPIYRFLGRRRDMERNRCNMGDATAMTQHVASIDSMTNTLQPKANTFKRRRDSR